MRLYKGDGRGVVAIMRAGLRLRRVLERDLGELGVTPVQVELLRELKFENGVSQAWLARKLHVTRQAIDRAFRELSAQELIERVQDETYDRREWLARLTSEGELRLDAALDVLAAVQETCLESLGLEEAERAIGAVERTTEALDFEERMAWSPLVQLLRR